MRTIWYKSQIDDINNIMNKSIGEDTMKTAEELNALKEEVEALNKKLAALNEEELVQVSGGLTEYDEEYNERSEHGGSSSGGSAYGGEERTVL